MALHKIVNGIKIDLTPEEEAETLEKWNKSDQEKLEDERLNGYKRKRQVEYPSIEQQLDYIWHAMNNGEIAKHNKFYQIIKAIKDKYPKP